MYKLYLTLSFFIFSGTLAKGNDALTSQLMEEINAGTPLKVSSLSADGSRVKSKTKIKVRKLEDPSRDLGIREALVSKIELNPSFKDDFVITTDLGVLLIPKTKLLEVYQIQKGIASAASLVATQAPSVPKTEQNSKPVAKNFTAPSKPASAAPSAAAPPAPQKKTSAPQAVPEAKPEPQPEQEPKPAPQSAPAPVVLENEGPSVDLETSAERERIPDMTVIPFQTPIKALHVQGMKSEEIDISSGELKVIRDDGKKVQAMFINRSDGKLAIPVYLEPAVVDALIEKNAQKNYEKTDYESVNPEDRIQNEGHTPSQILVGDEYLVPPGKALDMVTLKKKPVVLPSDSTVQVTRLKDETVSGVRSWGYELKVLSSDKKNLVGKTYYTGFSNMESLELIGNDEESKKQQESTEDVAVDAEEQGLLKKVIQEVTGFKPDQGLSSAEINASVCREDVFSFELLNSYKNRQRDLELSHFKTGNELARYLACYNKNNKYFGRKDVPSYLSWIKEAAKQFGLPEAVMACLIMQESMFNPNAQSPYATGIAQFTPATIVDLDNLIYNTNASSGLIKEEEKKLQGLKDAKSIAAKKAKIQRLKLLSEAQEDWKRYFFAIGKPVPSELTFSKAARTPHIAIAVSTFYIKYILNKIDIDLNYDQKISDAQKSSRKHASENLSMLDLTILSTGFYNAGPNIMSRVFSAKKTGKLEDMIGGARLETRNHMRYIKNCAQKGNTNCKDEVSKKTCHEYKECFLKGAER